MENYIEESIVSFVEEMDAKVSSPDKRVYKT